MPVANIYCFSILEDYFKMTFHRYTPHGINLHQANLSSVVSRAYVKKTQTKKNPTKPHKNSLQKPRELFKSTEHSARKNRQHYRFSAPQKWDLGRIQAPARLVKPTAEAWLCRGSLLVSNWTQACCPEHYQWWGLLYFLQPAIQKFLHQHLKSCLFVFGSVNVFFFFLEKLV